MRTKEDTISSSLGDVPENPLKIVKTGVDEEVEYSPFFTALSEASGHFAHTFEFFVKQKKIYVRYDNHPVEPLKNLLSSRYYPEIRGLLKQLFDYINFRYSSSRKMQQWKREGKKWEEIIVLFIATYFSKYQDPLDVVIQSNGNIILNSEEPIKN